MIKNTVVCDRCGKEINESTYYAIDINGNDVHPSKDGRVSSTTFCHRAKKVCEKLSGTEHHYCSECAKDISDYINTPKISIKMTTIFKRPPDGGLSFKRFPGNRGIIIDG